MAGTCPTCGQVPDLLADARRLVLWAPTPHTAGKIRRAARDCGVPETAHSDACFDLALNEASVGRPLDALAATLRWDMSSQESQDTRALVLTGDRQPGLVDLGDVISLEAVLGRIESRWLITMMGEDRLTSHYQPIVRTDDSRQIFAFEALIRGDDGQGGIVSGGRLMGAARDADLLFQMDYAARASAVSRRPTEPVGTKLFINFSPAAIYDPVFCLRETVALIEDRQIVADEIVFEVTESEKVTDLDHLKNILGYYRQRGFGVALDDLGSGYASLNMLHELRPDYVKIDMDLISGVQADPVKATIAAKVLETADALGCPAIAEGIETAADLEWVRQHGAPLAQGYYFSKPSPTGALA